MKIRILLAGVCLLLANAAQAVLIGTDGLNDASRIVKCGSKYFWYSTGAGIKMRWTSAPETGVWNTGPDVFPTRPAWWANWNANSAAWAPDVIYHPGRDEYHMYYCLSTVGSNTSAIGLAVNKTLDPNAANYAWVDKGIVISTRAGVDSFNALDPCPVVTPADEWFLCFGSHLGGVKLIRLNAEGLRHPTLTTMWGLATHSTCEAGSIYPGTKNSVAGYWLFVNWGSGAANGESSTYQVRMGWSTNVRGPYLDKTGADMYTGGGTLFMPTQQSFSWDGSTRIGRGHASLIHGLALDGTHTDWVSYSYYLHNPPPGDGKRFGLQRLTTDANGWPDDGLVFQY